MYMIRTYLCFDNIHLFPITQFSQYFPYFCSEFSIEHHPSIFRSNTIWYLQFHVVCAKLLLSFILNDLLLIFVQLPDRTSIISKGVLFSYATLKLFLNPRHSRGFSLHNNESCYTKLCSSFSFVFHKKSTPEGVDFIIFRTVRLNVLINSLTGEVREHSVEVRLPEQA